MSRFANLLLIALAGCLHVGCGSRSSSRPSVATPALADFHNSQPVPGGIHQAPLADVPRTARPFLFERLSREETGIDFNNPLDTSHPLKRLYYGYSACGGVAIGDVDNDGRPDIYLVSGPGQNKLYRQVDNWKFEDVTDKAGVGGGDCWGAGATMADVDNDGDLDLYVCNYDAPNALYLNQGDGTFTDRAKEMGVDIVDASVMAAFADYDLDGDLDLFLLTNRFHREGGRPAKPPFAMNDGKPFILPEYEKYYYIKRTGPNKYTADNVGRPDRLLRNDGGRSFTDVTDRAGIRGFGHGLSATWWDYDEDGLVDLYVGNDFDDPDVLYHNNGDGTFTNTIADVMPHTTWSSMGADVGDVNTDGRLDFLSVDMSGTNHFKQKTTMGVMNSERIAQVAGPPPQVMRNALYVNAGAGHFWEAAYLAGLADTDWSWAVKLIDLDNDGHLDVFVTNGVPRSFNDSDIPFRTELLIGRTVWDIYERTPARPERNLAFRNAGNFQFEEVGSRWGLDQLGMSFAAAHADMDRDGDLDLVVMNLEEPVGIYRNESAEGGRVLIRLFGQQSNRFGLGAKITVETAAGKQVRELNPATGFMSSNEPLVHFGLGTCAVIDKLEVRWPSGHRQTFFDLPAGRFYAISEPSGDVPVATSRESRETMFGRSRLLRGAVHRETTYDDFAREPLLPNKLSQLGPGLAWGDADGDGREDVYLSGAAGQPGALFLRDHDGQFHHAEVDCFLQDADCEDMAPLWFDADGDGDFDLYVVSGGVECDAKSDLLQDRLYLNNGRGEFRKAPEGTLPQMRDSGSVATACDFDRDGDLDLFVGGRVIPGAYPLPPNSHLLLNEGGRFREVTAELAPGLSRTGMVTGAVWSDADADGWIDLLVTHEWGPVKLFKNDSGRLVDVSDKAGLADLLGWWNGIAARDLDNDGDVDYVVTNFGLNTKYHASPEKPALLYYGDFEGNGRRQLVEAEFESDVLYPIRGKSCSTKAMPHLAEKFTTFKDFALAPLENIYTAECLDRAHRFKANTLESGVLWNDGDGHFQFQPLPRLAQVSPSFGVVLADVNGDGHVDIYLVQNFFSPQPETGRMDGGLSLLLAGSGSAKTTGFTPIWPDRSGLVVSGDAKGLATTDLNDDGWPDFVVAINNGQLLAFENQGTSANRTFAVQLAGNTGNPTAVGARVTVVLTDGSRQTAEVQAGSGYLSQSSSRLVFGLGTSNRVTRIDVIWPDGQSSSSTPAEDARTVVIKQPGIAAST